MIVCRILFVALSVSVSSGYHFHTAHNDQAHLRFRPGNTPTLQLNEEAEELGSGGHYNTMIRRGKQPVIFAKKHNPRKLKDYDVKTMSLDNLKSLELDNSLENLLALDAQEKQQKEKINLGFKVVNLKDFDHDRQRSKISTHKKVKLVQSLVPPQKFFNKYLPGDILKRGTGVANLNVHSNKLFNYRPKSIKPGANTKSIFNEDGMMFLTKPENAEERKLSALINKVLKFKSDQGKQGPLRQPKEVFTTDEIKHIKLIARAIDEEAREDENENEALDELFLRELLQGEEGLVDKAVQKLSKQASSEPLEIKVAVVPPPQNKIHLDLSQALQLLDDDDEIRESYDNDMIRGSNDDDKSREIDDKKREWADYDETWERYYDDKTRDRYNDDIIRERYDYEESLEKLNENANYERKRERHDDDKSTEKYDNDKRDRADLAQVIADAIASINKQRNNDDRDARAVHVKNFPGRRLKRVNDNSNKKQQLNQFARAIRSAKSLDEQDAAPAINKQQFDFKELVA